MEKFKLFIDGLGIAWEITVILIAISAFLVWMDLFIGSRVRTDARGLISTAFEAFANWYALRRNIMKAISMHLATRKQYHVIMLGDMYYVVNKQSRQRINRLFRRHGMKRITIVDVIRTAAYSTK